MVLAWNIHGCKLVSHCLNFEVKQSRVGDVSKLLVAHGGQEWFMVHTQNQVLMSEEENFTFFKTILDSTGLTFYGVISGLCW